MQSAVSPLTVCDLWGAPQGIFRARVIHRTAVQVAYLCGSFVVCVSESSRVFLKHEVVKWYNG